MVDVYEDKGITDCESLSAVDGFFRTTASGPVQEFKLQICLRPLSSLYDDEGQP